MKYLLITLVLLLSACGSLPVVNKFPDAPTKSSMEKCPQLATVENGVKLSELTKTITMNYSTYYECAVKTDAWIEWYQIQNKIHEDIKK